MFGSLVAVTSVALITLPWFGVGDIGFEGRYTMSGGSVMMPRDVDDTSIQ